jgi:hypothetical protein
MPGASKRQSDRARPQRAWTAALLVAALAAGAATPAAAQDASYFSPTYAASDGSPYSSVYARTFGAGGPPAQPAPPPEAPLETSAAPTAAPPQSGTEGVVYVIEDGRLLTYRAEDYARGRGAVAGAAVPPAVTGSAGSTPPADLSSITNRLYGAPPPGSPLLPTAAGPAAPIQLVPPQGQPAN